MAFQYNSRFGGKYLQLKPLPSTSILGKCCYGNSFATDVQKSGCTGYFIETTDPNQTCPSPSELGTCCSCSAVTNRDTFNEKTTNGIELNVSKCDCEQKGGLWRAGTAPLAGYGLREIKRACTSVYGIDVRIPKACCYSGLSGGVYVPMCEDVCNVYDCSQKGQSGTQKSFWASGRRCLVDTAAGGPVITLCTPEATAPTEQLSVPCAEGIDCFSGELAGTCCTRDYDTETTSCSTTTKRNCKGWWLSSAYGLASCEDNYCGAITFPTKAKTPILATESYSNLQSSINIFTKMPQTGEIYQGGVFVGIFNNYTSDTPSTLYGNAATGTAQNYITREDPFGTTKKRWMLIVSSFDYGSLEYDETESEQTLETSYYDGFFNTYGNGKNFYGPNTKTFNELRGKNINGFIDWYIPSQDECAFISQELNYNFYIPDGFYKFMSNTYYMTSTVWFNRNSNSVRTLADQTVYSNYFVYGHHFGKPTVGKTAIVSRNTALPIRLCRRIYLED